MNYCYLNKPPKNGGGETITKKERGKDIKLIHGDTYFRFRGEKKREGHEATSQWVGEGPHKRASDGAQWGGGGGGCHPPGNSARIWVNKGGEKPIKVYKKISPKGEGW